MTARHDCPDPLRLQELLLGRLPGPDADELEQHLATCDRCATTVHSLPGEDELSRALRPPLTPEDTPRSELAQALIPALKRLRPRDATATWDTDPAESPRTATLSDGGGAAAPLPAFPGLPGDGRLGGYVLLGPLGSGGMGIVFRAEDQVLKRRVGLKIIRPGLVASPEARTRFLREAQALAALEHDHIVTVFQAGEDNGVLFLAMQLLRGQTLQHRLDAAGGPLQTDEILRVGRETASGLAAAHARGLIHRDIKPANIWLEEARNAAPGPGGEGGSSAAAGRVKILDFGLVQALAGEDVGGHTPGRLLGTPAYMAPEQAGGKPVDGRADLFSLGCVLYQMATGRRPFEADDLIGLLTSITLTDPPPLRGLNPGLPESLDRLIVALLAKKPVDRPPSAEAVVEAIRAIEESRRPRPSRRAWLIGTAAAALAGGIAVGAVGRWMPSPPPAPGEVAFEFDAADARVALRRGDDPERVVDVRAEKTVSLPPGDYTIRPVAAGKLVLRPGRVVVESGAKQIVTLQLVGEAGSHRAHGFLPLFGLVVTRRKDELLVVSVGLDRALVRWNPAEKGRPRRVEFPESPLRCAALSPDGRTLAVGCGGVGPQTVLGVRFWDADTLEPRQGEFDGRSQVNVIAYSPDGGRLLVGENDGGLALWDVKLGLVEAERKLAHPGGVSAVAFLPGGKRVLTAGADGLVERTADDLEQVRALDGHTRGSSLVVMPDGKHVVSAGQDATIRVWDLATGTARSWPTPAAVSALTTSPDGTRLLTGDAAGGVRLWDTATGTQIIQFDAGPKPVGAAAFTPDGRAAVTGGNDGSVRLWLLPK
jgi:anti-sigma factor RsiW/tRNA A-37 threonylcarbamoyl transferase component Bud32